MDRLGDILRMVLGGKTEGEKLAALAAFERVMRAAGLDLHDVAARLQGGAAPPSEPAGDDRINFSDPLVKDVPNDLACTIEDDQWPAMARWLLAQDAQWAAARNRHILRPNQLSFAEQMATEALGLRPSPRQCCWLLILVDRVIAAQARPLAQPRPALAGGMPAEPSGSEGAPARSRIMAKGRERVKRKEMLSCPDGSGVFVACGGGRRSGAKANCGGRGGIRTHEGAKPPAGFQDRCLKPLGHPSAAAHQAVNTDGEGTNVDFAARLLPGAPFNATRPSLTCLVPVRPQL
jgi:hypothetical protein